MRLSLPWRAKRRHETSREVWGPTEALVEWLSAKIESPERAGAVVSRGAAFSRLSAEAKVRELPSLYLLFEHYLAESEPHPVSRRALREEVAERFPVVARLDSFRLILEPEPLQEVLLCRFMLRRVLERAGDVLGGGVTGKSIAALLAWSEGVPDSQAPIPVPGGAPRPPATLEWVTELGRVATELHTHLAGILGDRATALFEAGYRDAFESYAALETFPVVIELLPERLLDEQKIVLLSRRQVQRVVLAQVDRLQRANGRLSEQNDELERIREELQVAKRELELRMVKRTEELESATNSLNSEMVERQRTQEALDLAHDQQEALLHGIPDPAWLKDSQQRFVAANDALIRLLNSDVIVRGDILPITREWLLGKVTGDLVEPEVAMEVGAAEEAILREGRTVRAERALTQRDGATRWLETITLPVRDRAGTISGIVGVARDVTERKQLEAKLLQSQKMEAVGRLAGGIAHDFNNLLTAIRGHMTFLLEDLEPGTEPYADAQGANQAVDRAASLTRQLLAFSRKQLLQPKVVELNGIVEEMQRMLERLIGEDVALITRMSTELGRVRADPGQIEQVILNLAVNARDAMPDGGTLLIETQNVELDPEFVRGQPLVAAGQYVLIAVTDTGTGMDEQTQAQIFEPFYTTKEVGRGTGLGLATVYGIVQQSGGFVWVYSELGKGSTFKVYLPRVDEAATVVSAPVRPSPAGGAETILLAEDDRAVRALARRLLERAGYRVLEAGNGKEALGVAAAFEGRVDLLLTDAVMPEVGGRELAERLLENHPGVAVLCMSGYTDDAVLRHGMISDGAGFLEKPFTPDALLRNVRALLDRRN